MGVVGLDVSIRNSILDNRGVGVTGRQILIEGTFITCSHNTCSGMNTNFNFDLKKLAIHLSHKMSNPQVK